MLASLVTVGVTNPGSLEPVCGHEGAAQPARVVISALCPVLGPTWGLPWSRNVTGMLFQNQPPGGAQSPTALQVELALGNVESLPIIAFLFPTPF